MNVIWNGIKKIECIIFVIIVLVDLLTKLMANIFLPFREMVCFIGEKVCFFLIYNQDPTGGQANAMLQNYSNKNLLILSSCFSALVLLAYILFIRKQKMRTLYKILIGIGVFVIVNILTEFILPIFEGVNISSWTTSVFGKLTALTIIFCIIFYFNLNKWVRLSLVIIFAAGIGNLLSHFYYPYQVVDFIYVKGSYELLRIGVFNGADLAFNIGFLGLIISLLISGIKKVS